MNILVLVEHEGGTLKDATLATVTAAGKLGEVHAAGRRRGLEAKQAAEAAAKIAGVEQGPARRRCGLRAQAGGERRRR